MQRTLPDWLAYIEAQHPTSIDMCLERVRVVASRLLAAPLAGCVITVAGTNGKGSTVAFIEAIARAAGLRVGTYTSPHLLAYNERVRIDGADVGDALLVEAFEAVEAARHASPLDLSIQGQGSSVSLTYFEFGTLAALWLFARSGLDLVVLEVGLGGRLDATNLIDADVSVVTTVDLDHQDWLGADREAIGSEKAGIARAWKPLVLGEDDPPASVLRHAYAIGASAVRAGCDFFFQPILSSARPGLVAGWRWHEPGFELDLPLPRLAAPVQLRNAATAIAALRASELRIPDQAYALGVAGADIAGRLQRFERTGVQWLVDAGHNPQAARALAQWLQATPVQGRTIAVYAALADKDPAGVVAALAKHVDAWWIAGSLEAGARGQGVDALATRLAGSAARAAARCGDVASALEAAGAAARRGDRILVFGSFHAAAAALRALNAA